MNRHDDPLEQLLEHAFAEELTRTADPDIGYYQSSETNPVGR